MSITKIGWIGTGVMGKSMCKHLLKAGFELSVYNRTESKVEELVSLGAKKATLLSIFSSSDVVVTMLGYPKDLQDLLYSQDLLPKIKPGGYYIDHTTSSPLLAQEISKSCQRIGVHAYDAPVSGGDIGARNGKLVTMLGGEEASLAAVLPVMHCYSAKVQLMGAAGKGQHTKMANQIFIAGQMIGVIEGLLYAFKAGLDQTEVIELLSKGAANSFSLTAYGPRILKHDFEPGFYVEHFLKDLKIALDECKKFDIQLKGLELAYQFYDYLEKEGYGRKGTQALYIAISKLNKLNI